MLYNGEEVGDGNGPECDVAVDPIDGTTLTAKGQSNAVSVLAVSDRGSMYDPSAVFYMDKLVTGPEAADVVDIRLPVAENIKRIAKAKKETVEDVTVVMLDRPRHHAARRRGARRRRAAAVHLRRRRGRRDHGGPRRHRHRPAAGHRRHPRGDHHRLRHQVPRRGHPGPAVAAGRRRAPAGRRRRARPRPGAVHRRPGHRRELLLRGDRHHRRRAAQGRALPRRRRDHALAGDALQVGHDPADREPPPARQAARLLVGGLRPRRPPAAPP